MTKTEEAKNAVADIENLLLHTLSNKPTIKRNTLSKKFTEPIPCKPINPKPIAYPDEPKKTELNFTLIEQLFRSERKRRIAENECDFQKRFSQWKRIKTVIDIKNKLQTEQYNQQILDWQQAVNDWKIRKQKFLSKRTAHNNKVKPSKPSCISIVDYCKNILTKSIYPSRFPKSFEIEYIADTKILIIEYQLPPPLEEAGYIISRNGLKPSFRSESQRNKIFDDASYMIALRTIDELIEADVADAIDAVSFNGWVRTINPATGNEENKCILSIQVKKEVFKEINLANVDPKTCFKHLKGVASSALSSLTPIPPILQISKFDKRFVDAHGVVSSIDTSTNLAAMDWEDFEHLVRELFEKEFQVNGGEVKITQASRDGGVDAVAFDPDPIRGGKIVIQAKRYTNTVGVSAVRDLYGTTLNEGATKGILVSTADYGPDAYEFAKGKPLTLLNGGHLLHLLQKHGYHAKIDLREAKKILSEQR